MSLKKLNMDKLGNSSGSDEMLLPQHYTRIDEPHYSGPGNHSVKSLQELCESYKEYCHQQAIIKQELIKLIKNGN